MQKGWSGCCTCRYPLLQQAHSGRPCKHFTELHDQCELPIVIYNIPGRSSIDMSPETMGHLAKLPRVIGVKDATGDLARVCAQRITCGPDFYKYLVKTRLLMDLTLKVVSAVFLSRQMWHQNYPHNYRLQH